MSMHDPSDRLEELLEAEIVFHDEDKARRYEYVVFSNPKQQARPNHNNDVISFNHHNKMNPFDLKFPHHSATIEILTPPAKTSNRAAEITHHQHEQNHVSSKSSSVLLARPNLDAVIGTQPQREINAENVFNSPRHNRQPSTFGINSSTIYNQQSANKFFTPIMPMNQNRQTLITNISSHTQINLSSRPQLQTFNETTASNSDIFSSSFESDWSHSSHVWSPEEIGAVFLVSVIIPFIVVSNILVIFSVVRFRRLHTPTNYFIASLAAVDILIGIITPLVVAVQIFQHDALDTNSDGAMSNALLCLLPNRVLMMSCGVSLLNLAAIAYDRHTALTCPLEYINIMTSQKVTVLMTLSWLYSAIVVWLPLAVGWYDLTFPATHCSADHLHKKAHILFISAIFVPSCVVIFICYSRIFLLARYHAKSIAAVELAVHRRLQVRFMMKDTKYAKTLALVIGGFLILWLPYLLFTFIKTIIGISVSVWLETYLVLLAVFNSGVNPWIYAFKNNEFKAAFRRMAREYCHGFAKSCFEREERRGSLVSACSTTPRLSRSDSRIGPAILELPIESSASTEHFKRGLQLFFKSAERRKLARSKTCYNIEKEINEDYRKEKGSTTDIHTCDTCHEQNQTRYVGNIHRVGHDDTENDALQTQEGLYDEADVKNQKCVKSDENDPSLQDQNISLYLEINKHPAPELVNTVDDNSTSESNCHNINPMQHRFMSGVTPPLEHKAHSISSRPSLSVPSSPVPAHAPLTQIPNCPENSHCVDKNVRLPRFHSFSFQPKCTTAPYSGHPTIPSNRLHNLFIHSQHFENNITPAAIIPYSNSQIVPKAYGDNSNCPNFEYIKGNNVIDQTKRCISLIRASQTVPTFLTVSET